MKRLRVKMCGITRSDDANFACTLGVDALGLIFCKSPRQIDIKQASEILASRSPFVTIIGVFNDDDFKSVREVVQNIQLDILQFHGDEDEAFCRQFNKPYIKTITVTPTTVIEEEMTKHNRALAFLLDLPKNNSIAKTIDINCIPKKAYKPIILSGGLNSTNIRKLPQELIYGVDVCSGVEKSPGIKDHGKMQQFMEIVGGLNA